MNYQEQKEEKRRAREREGRRVRIKNRAKKTATWTAVAALIFGGGYFLFRGASPEGPDFSQPVPVFGQNHVLDGTKVTYNSNPPTSGPHYQNPARVDFYDEQLPDEALVHNLEHGQIWISYGPGVGEEVKEQLRKLTGGFVIVTRRPENDTDIALAAWGRLDKFNLEGGVLDLRRIRDFVLRYQNKGPEKVSSAAHLR